QMYVNIRQAGQYANKTAIDLGHARGGGGGEKQLSVPDQRVAPGKRTLLIYAGVFQVYIHAVASKHKKRTLSATRPVSWSKNRLAGVPHRVKKRFP
ncbi:MAG: hypothetical protein LUC89_04155, partial [Oscillospiraceae bacterium]|nr:hypothetical protein [Oscillospiraceae bacterium]